MKRPLRRRVAPNLDKTLHMSMVRLNIEVKRLLNQEEPMNVIDIQRLCDVIKSLLTIQKLMPKLRRKSKKDVVDSPGDLLE